MERIPRDVPIHISISSALESSFREWHGSMAGGNVDLYVEPSADGQLAGPVRAVAQCIEDLRINDDVLIMMGDSILPFSLDEFLDSHTPESVKIAAYRVHSLEEARRFGVVEWSGGVATRFEEKPSRPRSPWVFVGCLFIPQRLVALLRGIAAECPPQMGELVASLLEMGEDVRVYPVTQEWHDIGTFSSYLEAHRALLSPAQSISLREMGNQLGGVVYVHPTAQVSGSTLSNCIVHEGAVVSNATLQDCVIHPCVSITDRAISRKLVSREVELSFA